MLVFITAATYYYLNHGLHFSVNKLSEMSEKGQSQFPRTQADFSYIKTQNSPSIEKLIVTSIQFALVYIIIFYHKKIQNLALINKSEF